jgi:pyruvate formate lyase activating enzyme
VLNRLIELRLVDYIAMDLKALFADYRKACGTVCPAAALEESITLLRKSGLAYELRTTAVRPSQRDLADLVATGLQATGAPRYYLQPFRRDTSIDPAFVAEAQPFSAAELNRAARYLKQHGIACRVR